MKFHRVIGINDLSDPKFLQETGFPTRGPTKAGNWDATNT